MNHKTTNPALWAAIETGRSIKTLLAHLGDIDDSIHPATVSRVIMALDRQAQTDLVLKNHPSLTPSEVAQMNLAVNAYVVPTQAKGSANVYYQEVPGLREIVQKAQIATVGYLMEGDVDDFGGEKVNLGLEPWKMQYGDVVDALNDDKLCHLDTQAWRYHGESISSALRRKEQVPPHVLFEHHDLIRDFSAPLERDLALESMQDTLRTTGDYTAAVQAYRDFRLAAAAGERLVNEDGSESSSFEDLKDCIAKLEIASRFLDPGQEAGPPPSLEHEQNPSLQAYREGVANLIDAAIEDLNEVAYWLRNPRRGSAKQD